MVSELDIPNPKVKDILRKDVLLSSTKGKHKALLPQVWLPVLCVMWGISKCAGSLWITPLRLSTARPRAYPSFYCCAQDNDCIWQPRKRLTQWMHLNHLKKKDRKVFTRNKTESSNCLFTVMEFNCPNEVRQETERQPICTGLPWSWHFKNKLFCPCALTPNTLAMQALACKPGPFRKRHRAWRCKPTTSSESSTSLQSRPLEKTPKNDSDYKVCLRWL